MVLALFQGTFDPTLFAMALRGTGNYTKLMSTGLTMAVSGGAIWPTISWAIPRAHDDNDR
jgi:fucose permease